MQKTARLPYIDIAKGFAMLLVIVGHCTYSHMGLISWLYSFHMPLFFALSGFTFRAEKYNSLREIIKVKFRQLIIPYFVFNTVLWALSVLLLDGLRFEYRHLNELIGIVVSKRLSRYFFSLWFFNTLFLSEPLLWCCIRLTKDRTLPLAALSAGMFVFGAAVLQVVKGTYWSADLVPIALSFLFLGYLLRRWMSSMSSKPSSSIFLLLAWSINLLFCVFNYRQGGRSDLYFCKLVNPLYFFLSACGGTVGTILLCSRITRCTALEYIGKNSIIFYAFESLAIPLSERLLRFVLGADPQTSLLAVVLVLLMSCAMLSLASLAYPRIKRSCCPKPSSAR